MAGRDIEFRIKVVGDDPTALKKVADDAVKIQKKLDDEARKSIKNKVDEERKAQEQIYRERQRWDKKEADEYLRSERKRQDDKKRETERHRTWERSLHERAERQDYEFRKRLRDQQFREDKKREDDLARYRESVRKKSAELEQREKLRLAKEEQRELANEMRVSYRVIRMEQIREARRDAATHRIVSGAIGLGSGLAGAIGGEGGSAIGRALEYGATGWSTFQLGKGVVGGIGALKTGLPAGSNAAVAAGAPTAGAAAAAIVAWLPALAAAIKGAAIAVKGSETTTSVGKGGSISAAFGEGVARSGWTLQGMLSRYSSTESLEAASKGNRGFFGFGVADQASLELSGRKAALSDKSGKEMVARQQGLASDITAFGALGRERVGEAVGVGNQLGRARELQGQLGSIYGRSQGGARSAALEQLREVESDILRLQKEQHQEALQTARARVSGSREEVQNLKEAYSTAKETAKSLQRAYHGDVIKAATASPEEQERLREISRKIKAGQDLDREEIGLAGQYNMKQFQEASEKSALAEAKRLGLEDIFAPAKKEADTAAKKASDLAAQVSKAELTLKQQHEFVVKMEGDKTHEQLATEISKVIKEQTENQLNRQTDVVLNRVEQRLKTFSVNHKP